MRILILMMCLLTAAGCTRPSAGFSFHDVVQAASEGLREYEGWVQAEGKQTDVNFPDELCLAGVFFTAALAETTSNSGQVGLPLAAPSLGLTGMLGYKFTSTESRGGNISASLLAQYPGARDGGAEKSAVELTAFLSNLDRHRVTFKAVDLETGQIQAPMSLSIEEKQAFLTRRDLAAELWRIRQALHNAFLTSPATADSTGLTAGYLLVPGPVSFNLGFTMQGGAGVAAKINLGAQQVGATDFGTGASESNRMVLIYMKNRSADRMNCDATSFGATDAAGIEAFNTAFATAVEAAIKGDPGTATVPKGL
ncbi:MAG: hypothetical protein AAF674_18670 [Pseudomonadota bacterium]